MSGKRDTKELFSGASILSSRLSNPRTSYLSERKLRSTSCGTSADALSSSGPTNSLVGPLLTDLYQITMTYAYWKQSRHTEHAVFDLFFRKNPFSGEFCLFAGLDEVLG